MTRLMSSTEADTIRPKASLQFPKGIMKRIAIMVLITVIVTATCAYRDRAGATEITYDQMANAVQQAPSGFYNESYVSVSGWYSSNYSLYDYKLDVAYSVDADTYRQLAFHYSPPGMENNMTGSAAARANGQIGTLSGMASTGGATDGLYLATDASSTVGFWDTITTGQAGAAFIQFSGLISGRLITTSSDMDASAFVELRTATGTVYPGAGQAILSAASGIDHHGNLWQQGDANLGGGQAVPFSVRMPYAGGPTRYNFILFTEATLRGDPVPSFGDATAEFSHTMQVTGLQVLDSSGAPIADAVWVAASGHDYNAPPSEVPEPATMLLLGLGLMGVAGIRRFKR